MVVSRTALVSYRFPTKGCSCLIHIACNCLSRHVAQGNSLLSVAINLFSWFLLCAPIVLIRSISIAFQDSPRCRLEIGIVNISLRQWWCRYAYAFDWQNFRPAVYVCVTTGEALYEMVIYLVILIAWDKIFVCTNHIKGQTIPDLNSCILACMKAVVLGPPI